MIMSEQEWKKGLYTYGWSLSINFPSRNVYPEGRYCH